jgi:hypothetical protein
MGLEPVYICDQGDMFTTEPRCLLPPPWAFALDVLVDEERRRMRTDLMAGGVRDGVGVGDWVGLGMRRRMEARYGSERVGMLYDGGGNGGGGGSSSSREGISD